MCLRRFFVASRIGIDRVWDGIRANDEYLKWQKLGKQRDPEAWEMYPSMVNAYFNPPANEVRGYSLRVACHV